MQSIIVYDKNWMEIAFVDSYISLIWTKRFTAAGDFELYLPFLKRYVEVFKPGNYVSIKENKDIDIYAMVIEHVEITQTSSDGITMLISGHSLFSLLNRRVLYDDIVKTTTKFGFIRSLINECYGSNSLPTRTWGSGEGETYTLNDLTYDDSKSIHAAAKGENLSDVITEFCEEKGIGIDILKETTDNRYNIYIYKGIDKSENVFFKSELDNLSECKYVQDITKYANVARISSDDTYATAPNGAELTSNPELRGLNRFEKSFSTDIGGENEKYNALMSSGTRQLRKAQNTESFTANIRNCKTYEYGVDYDVGDIVTVITDFGITATAQISEMTESWSSDDYELIPTFGNYIIMPQEV